MIPNNRSINNESMITTVILKDTDEYEQVTARCNSRTGLFRFIRPQLQLPEFVNIIL